MKVQRQDSDRISALPQDTLEKILTLMPIRDAMRTSILSKKWRYCWTRMPKVVFDKRMVDVYSDNKVINKYKLANAILHVLLLQKGPILEFVVSASDTNIFNEFDQIILHLSRNNYIKKFIFEIWSPNHRYKLPSLFFSLHGLEHLDLTDCVFEPPLMFKGFCMLRNLRFNRVDITTKTLLRFLTNCPLLEKFTMIRDRADLTRRDECTFLELFKCLPSVQHLEMSRFRIEHFATGVIPQKLPVSLVHLRILMLDVCSHELSSVLWVISSFPNLEKIKVEMCWRHSSDVDSKNLLENQDYSGLNLNHLKELEITGFRKIAPRMEFVKLIMAKSPLLKKARIELCTFVAHCEEVQMLRDLVLLPFPRASPTAKLIIERPKKLLMNAN